MMESFLYAGTNLNLPFRAIALTRNAKHFSERFPHLASDPRVDLVESDAATMPIPEGPVDYVIHSLFAPAPLADMERQFERATARLLEVSSKKRASGCLLCSTGAVYKPSSSGSPTPEDWPRFGAGDPLSYPRIRSQVEDQWQAGFASCGLPVTIARGFAFIGPRLPLDGQFAIGNFLRDVLNGRPVTVRGDGASIRSYLHASDLTIRLWHLLLGGQPGGIYNVGSENTITIGEAARAIARVVDPPANVEILCHDPTISCYVPNTALINQSFGLPPPLAFPEALARTWDWLRRASPHR